MEITQFLVIYPTYQRLAVVQKVLPSILEETNRNDARLMVIDNSITDDEKREYLLQLRKQEDFFLLVSDNTSYASSRNLGLRLGQELYAPEYICILDDDHGLKEGFIKAMVKAMRKYYGKKAPTGLRYGMFTACHVHTLARVIKRLPFTNLYYPDYEGQNQTPLYVAGANGCCRCSPTRHWVNILGMHDTDEYPISFFQSSGPRWRNYHHGFTAMYVGKPGEYLFDLNEEDARGDVRKGTDRLWDSTYTKSDARSRYRK